MSPQKYLVLFLFMFITFTYGLFCSNCGNKIHDGTKFCPNCGTQCSISGSTGFVGFKPKMFDLERDWKNHFKIDGTNYAGCEGQKPDFYYLDLAPGPHTISYGRHEETIDFEIKQGQTLEFIYIGWMEKGVLAYRKKYHIVNFNSLVTCKLKEDDHWAQYYIIPVDAGHQPSGNYYVFQSKKLNSDKKKHSRLCMMFEGHHDKINKRMKVQIEREGIVQPKLEKDLAIGFEVREMYQTGWGNWKLINRRSYSKTFTLRPGDDKTFYTGCEEINGQYVPYIKIGSEGSAKESLESRALEDN